MFLPYWLAALYLPDVGPHTFMRWLTSFPDIKQLFHATRDELLSAGIAPKHVQSIQHPNWQSVERDLAWAEMPDHHLLTIRADDYPSQLKEIFDPPLVLFVCGTKTALAKMQIAIVGSRQATMSGLKNAEMFAAQLAAAGCAITSGLALGIDAASHRGALQVSGVTIAVLGTGLQRIYPRQHQALAQDIMQQQGALVSEFPLATPAHAYHFPRRNRIISGLARGVLVVEAALKSGSLITARHAIEQGRDVFAIPGSIHQPLAAGCHYLIRQGAKLVESAADILEELMPYQAEFSFSIPGKPQSQPTNLSLNEKKCLSAIGHEATAIDAILMRTGLTASEVSSILLKLELQGHATSVPGGYILAIAN